MVWEHGGPHGRLDNTIELVGQEALLKRFNPYTFLTRQLNVVEVSDSFWSMKGESEGLFWLHLWNSTSQNILWVKAALTYSLSKGYVEVDALREFLWYKIFMSYLQVKTLQESYKLVTLLSLRDEIISRYLG